MDIRQKILLKVPFMILPPEPMPDIVTPGAGFCHLSMRVKSTPPPSAMFLLLLTMFPPLLTMLPLLLTTLLLLLTMFHLWMK